MHRELLLLAVPFRLRNRDRVTKVDRDHSARLVAAENARTVKLDVGKASPGGRRTTGVPVIAAHLRQPRATANVENLDTVLEVSNVRKVVRRTNGPEQGACVQTPGIDERDVAGIRNISEPNVTLKRVFTGDDMGAVWRRTEGLQPAVDGR